jgi:hypothetical protein
MSVGEVSEVGCEEERRKRTNKGALGKSMGGRSVLASFCMSSMREMLLSAVPVRAMKRKVSNQTRLVAKAGSY